VWQEKLRMQGQSLIANLRYLVEQMDKMENPRQVNGSSVVPVPKKYRAKSEEYTTESSNDGGSLATSIVKKLGVTGSDLSRVVHAAGRRRVDY
jgi:hypothetical protein